MRLLFIITAIAFFNFQFSIFNFQPQKAYADTSCQPIYGGGETCVISSDISIDKKVLNPKTNLLVDNLGVNDPKYEPDFVVTFQIKITNTGKDALSKVDVKDVLPQYMLFSSAEGTFDENTKTLSLNIPSLKSNETKTFNILGRIVSEDQLPQAVVCVVNQVTANANNSQTSQDNSQFCIEKKPKEAVPATKGGFPVLPPSKITTSPPTGPESLVLFSLIPTGIAGWLLRKYTYNKLKMKGGE